MKRIGQVFTFQIEVEQSKVLKGCAVAIVAEWDKPGVLGLARLKGVEVLVVIGAPKTPDVCQGAPEDDLAPLGRVGSKAQSEILSATRNI